MTNTDFGAADGVPPSADRDRGASLKGTAVDAVESVKAEAKSFAASVQDKAAEAFSGRQETATETLSQFAGAIRKAGEDLAQNDQSLAGQLVKRAAHGLEDFTHAVRDKRPEELLDAVRDFGRRNPMAFVAGSVLVGLALGRLAKSSEHRSAGGGASVQGARQDPFSLPEPRAPHEDTVGGLGAVDPATGVARTATESQL